MAGPYPTHAAALADVDRALRIADQHDGRAWFMSWGTARVVDDNYRPDLVGTLNKNKLL
jgi:hypothetical protein